MLEIIIKYLFYFILFIPFFRPHFLVDYFLAQLCYLQFFINFILIYFFIKKDFYNQVKLKLIIPISFFIFFITLSFIFSKHKYLALYGTYGGREGLIAVYYFFLTYFFSAKIINFVDLKKIFLFLNGVLSLIVIINITNIFNSVNASNLFLVARTKRIIEQPSLLGGYLVSVIFISLTLAIYNLYKNKKQGIFFLSLFFLNCIVLLFTFSRGAIVSFLVVIFLFVVLCWIILPDKKLKYFNIILLIFLYAVTYFFPFKSSIENQKFTPLQRLQFSAKENNTTLFSRFTMWQSALFIIRNYFLTGSGVDTLSAVFPNYQKPDLVKNEGIFVTTASAHNQVLQIAATCGLPALFSWLWLIITFFWLSYNLFKSNLVKEYKIFLIGIICAVTAFLLQSLLVLNTLASNLLFWFYLGALEIIYKENYPPDLKANNFLKTFPRRNLIIYLILFLLLTIFSLKPLLGEYYFKKAMFNLSQKNYKQAEKNFNVAICYNPYELLYKLNMVISLRAQKKNYELLKTYQFLSNQYPYDPLILFNLAFVYEQLKKEKEAKIFYLRAYNICQKMVYKKIYPDYYPYLKLRVKQLFPQINQ